MDRALFRVTEAAGAALQLLHKEEHSAVHLALLGLAAQHKLEVRLPPLLPAADGAGDGGGGGGRSPSPGRAPNRDASGELMREFSSCSDTKTRLSGRGCIAATTVSNHRTWEVVVVVVVAAAGVWLQSEWTLRPLICTSTIPALCVQITEAPT